MDPSYFTSCPCTYFPRDIKYRTHRSEILLLVGNRQQLLRPPWSSSVATSSLSKRKFLSFDCFYLSLVYFNFSFFFLGRKVVFLNVSSFFEKLCTYHWSEWTIKMGFNRSACKVYWYGQTREYPDIISSAVWHWQIDATTSCNWNSKFLCALKLIFSRTTLF